MTEEECWDEFWLVIARAHADACLREAAENEQQQPDAA
jgi:hypothetical protein